MTNDGLISVLSPAGALLMNLVLPGMPEINSIRFLPWAYKE